MHARQMLRRKSNNRGMAVKQHHSSWALLVAVSIVAGATYPLLDWWWLTPMAGTVLKGSCVGLLAVAAALTARSRDGWLLAAVMAAGSAGDVLLGLPGGFVAGAAAFAVGHVLAIGLYWRNRSMHPAAWRWLVAGGLVAVGLVTPLLLVTAAQQSGLQVYALLLCAMAAAAWLGRFRVDRVGLGAVMFVASDALIGARLAGKLPDVLATSLAVWWLYYFGQLAIFAGVREGLQDGGSQRSPG